MESSGHLDMWVSNSGGRYEETTDPGTSAGTLRAGGREGEQRLKRQRRGRGKGGVGGETPSVSFTAALPWLPNSYRLI